MTNTKNLKAQIILNGYRLKDVAKELGITPQGLSAKIHNKSEFRASEIQTLCNILHIEDKDEYFFCA